MCDVGDDERLGLGTGWPAEQGWQEIEPSGSVSDVKGMTLQLERPAHQRGILVAHRFYVGERCMVPPDRHWCGAEVWRKGLHSYDQGESLLLDRTVIPLGGSKLAALVKDWIFHSIHNL